MKAGWELKALGDITSKIGSGSTPRGGQSAYKTIGTSLIRSMNVHDLKFKEKNLAFIDDEQAKVLENVSVLSGDVFINITGASIARCCVVPNSKLPARVNQHVSILRPLPEYLSSEFLSYLLVSKEQKDKLLGIGDDAGATRQALTKTQLQSFQIPLPPLEEQKRIVSILDEAFEGLDRARENAEANLKSARELFESTANSQLTASSEVKRVALGEVASIPSSLVDPKLPVFLDQPHVGAGNMVTGRDVLIDVKTSREEGLKSGKYTFDGNMVLYSKIRPYLRKVARPDFVGLCSADMYPLLPDSSLLDKDYLFHLLLSDDFTSYAIAGSDRAGMPKVNQTHLFKYQLSLPSIKSQKIAVQTIDQAMEKSELLQTDYRTKLQDISDLRQSLLQKAFAGELT